MQTAAQHHTVRFLSFTLSSGLAPTATVPDWLCALLAAHKPGSPDLDLALSRGHHGMCVQNVGEVAEGIEIWRLPSDQFLCFHTFSDGKPDTCIICNSIADFLMLQATVLGTMAVKIMQEDRYNYWREKELYPRHA